MFLIGGMFGLDDGALAQGILDVVRSRLLQRNIGLYRGSHGIQSANRH